MPQIFNKRKDPLLPFVKVIPHKPLTYRKEPKVSTNTSTKKHVNKEKGNSKSKSFPTGEAGDTEDISSEERSGMNMGTRKSKSFPIGEAKDTEDISSEEKPGVNMGTRNLDNKVVNVMKENKN